MKYFLLVFFIAACSQETHVNSLRPAPRGEVYQYKDEEHGTVCYYNTLSGGFSCVQVCK